MLLQGCKPSKFFEVSYNNKHCYSTTNNIGIKLIGNNYECIASGKIVKKATKKKNC